MSIAWLLTPDEKIDVLGKLQRAIARGQVDEEFIPWLEKFNKLPHLVTVGCCTGHGSREGYVFFRMTIPFEVLFEALAQRTYFQKKYTPLYGIFSGAFHYNPRPSFGLRFGNTWLDTKTQSWVPVAWESSAAALYELVEPLGRVAEKSTTTGV